jgi:hypothetical protein
MTKSRLLGATALSAIAAVWAATEGAQAADLGTSGFEVAAPARAGLPAVDGINGELELFGGGYSQGGIAAAQGSLSIPLGYRFGNQTDMMVGDIGGSFYGSIADHLFWRDPSVGLIGLYGNYVHYDGLGGFNLGQGAVEGEYYLGRFTVRGIAGIEGGHGGRFIRGGLLDRVNVQTRFFDKVNLEFFPIDDARLFVGHRYEGGRNAAALGGEYMFWHHGGTAASVFAEGELGEHDYKAVWAGLRVYFGNSDKSLIRRTREDDPDRWEPDTFFGVGSNIGSTPLATPGGGCGPCGPCGGCGPVS